MAVPLTFSSNCSSFSLPPFDIIDPYLSKFPLNRHMFRRASCGQIINSCAGKSESARTCVGKFESGKNHHSWPVFACRVCCFCDGRLQMK